MIFLVSCHSPVDAQTRCQRIMMREFPLRILAAQSTEDPGPGLGADASSRFEVSRRLTASSIVRCEQQWPPGSLATAPSLAESLSRCRAASVSCVLALDAFRLGFTFSCLGVL